MLKTAAFFRLAVNDCKISFSKLTCPDLFAQAGGCFGGFGKNHDASHRAVQTVDQPKIDLARLLVAYFEVFFQERQQIQITRGIALRWDVYGFFDY